MPPGDGPDRRLIRRCNDRDALGAAPLPHRVRSGSVLHLQMVLHPEVGPVGAMIPDRTCCPQPDLGTAPPARPPSHHRSPYLPWRFLPCTRPPHRRRPRPVLPGAARLTGQGAPDAATGDLFELLATDPGRSRRPELGRAQRQRADRAPRGRDGVYPLRHEEAGDLDGRHRDDRRRAAPRGPAPARRGARGGDASRSRRRTSSRSSRGAATWTGPGPRRSSATTAAASGMESSVFFTFWGLFAIVKPEVRITGYNWMQKMMSVMNPGSAQKAKLCRYQFGGAGPRCSRSSRTTTRVARPEGADRDRAGARRAG